MGRATPRGCKGFDRLGMWSRPSLLRWGGRLRGVRHRRSRHAAGDRRVGQGRHANPITVPDAGRAPECAPRACAAFCRRLASRSSRAPPPCPPRSCTPRCADTARAPPSRSRSSRERRCGAKSVAFHRWTDTGVPGAAGDSSAPRTGSAVPDRRRRYGWKVQTGYEGDANGRRAAIEDTPPAMAGGARGCCSRFRTGPVAPRQAAFVGAIREFMHQQPVR